MMNIKINKRFLEFCRVSCEKLLPIFIFVIFANSLFCEEQAEIVPPFYESKTGYLTALKDTQILPTLKKIFILQRQTLAIFSEDEDSFSVIADIEDESLICRIPKQRKFTTIITKTDEGRGIFFRGPVELETLPIELKIGVEIPIEIVLNDFYICLYKIRDFTLKIKISKNDFSFKFSEKSAFAKFAETQKKKGLIYYDNVWISEEDARKLKDAKEQEARKKEQKIKNILHAVNLGFAIFANGEVLTGRMSGQDEKGIIFETVGGEARYLQFDQMADMTFEDIIAAAKIDLTKNLLSEKSSVGHDNAGKIKKNCDEALLNLEAVSLSASETYLKEKYELAKIARKRISEVKEFLDKEGYALYKYKVFPSNILNWHLTRGNILLGNSWIKPEQKCAKCTATGSILCLKCEGKGKIKEKCPHCENGNVKCSICGGEGWKPCSACRGIGFFSRRCPRCSGSGFISSLVASPWFDDIQIINGKVIIKYHSFPFYYYQSNQICPDCGGTGVINVRCQICGGSGRLSCLRAEKCKFCNGTGIIWRLCPDCGGRGTVSCPDCGGKGFIGEEQKAELESGNISSVK